LSNKIAELELLNPALEQLQKKFVTLSIQVKLAAKPQAAPVLEKQQTEK